MSGTIEDAVAAHLDAAARGLGYDDIRSAVSYAEEPEVPDYMAEGRRFRRWRSRVWKTAFALIEAGVSEPGEVIAALPPLDDRDAPPGVADTPE